MPTKKPRKAPIRNSKALFARICLEIETGKTLTAVCRAKGMPTPAGFHKWVRDDEDLKELYNAARRIQMYKFMIFSRIFKN